MHNRETCGIGVKRNVPVAPQRVSSEETCLTVVADLHHPIHYYGSDASFKVIILFYSSIAHYKLVY